MGKRSACIAVAIASVLSAGLVRAGEETITEELALGVVEDFSYESKKILLQVGDTVFLYTDGVTEARSPEDELFSRNRLRSLIEQPFNTATELLERIKNNLFSFIDIAPRGDDVTMLAVQRVMDA